MRTRLVTGRHRCGYLVRLLSVKRNRMAANARVELTPTESKSVELTIIRTPNIYSVKTEFSQGTLTIVLPIVRFSKLLAGKMGLEPITHRCILLYVPFILYILYHNFLRKSIKI